MQIQLPHKFKPYAYQRETLKEFLINKKRFGVTVRSRRTGKTLEAINLLVAACFMRRGLYIHSFPSGEQARAVCYEAMDNDGIPLIDRIPKELIAHKRDDRMIITMVNGSKIRWIGTNDFDSKMGSNAVGMIYDEYSLQKPEVRYMMNPIFQANGGWQYFVYTPRGRNHGYDMIEIAKNDPEYFLQIKTCEECFDHDGNRVVSDERIQQDRRNGIPEEIIQQEYYCSFDASLVGNYYGDHIKKAREDGRICDFKIDPTLPVYTFWDLGGAKQGSDATAVWFVQKNGYNIDVIYYHETNLTPLTHFPKVLHEIQIKTGANIAKNYAPCDINIQDLFSGKSRLALAKSVGLHFQVLPGKLWNKPRIDGIECVWRIFHKLRIHKTNCELGIRALNEYRKEWDENRKCYKNDARHDWTSHAADAFRYFALIWTDSIGEKIDGTPISLKTRMHGT